MASDAFPKSIIGKENGIMMTGLVKYKIGWRRLYYPKSYFCEQERRVVCVFPLRKLALDIALVPKFCPR